MSTVPSEEQRVNKSKKKKFILHKIQFMDLNEQRNGNFDVSLRDETSVWASELNRNHVGYFMYIMIVPIFCVFGIITNSLNAIIFSRPRMVSSSYIYFTGIHSSYRFIYDTEMT